MFAATGLSQQRLSRGFEALKLGVAGDGRDEVAAGAFTRVLDRTGDGGDDRMHLLQVAGERFHAP